MPYERKGRNLVDEQGRRSEEETKAYLARIRKTIADSESMVSQVNLRIAETDRMLAQQGLTREQVMQMRFSEAQMEAVNEELKRRGMDPLERWSAESGSAAETPRPFSEPDPEPVGDDELAERRRKFGMMMKPFQI